MSSTCLFRRRFRAAVLLIGIGLSWSCIPLPIPTVGGGGGGGGTGSGSGGEDSDPPQIDWQENFGTLIHNGVTIATIAQLIKFNGWVEGRAPVVVDFELPTKGRLQLDIWVENAGEPTILEFRGTAGVRKIAKTKLPRKLKKWQAAELSLRAFDESGKEIDFRFFGVGVGDRAVGSTSIYQVTFRPSSIREGKTASWGFRSRSDFEHARVVFYRQDNGSAWKEGWTVDSSCLPRRGKRCKGQWDGSNDKDQNRSSGRHRIGVRAWQSSLEHDWIIVVSKQVVEVL